MLSWTLSLELTMPSPIRVSLPWAKPLKPFRPRIQGEPQKDYLAKLAEDQQRQVADQKQSYLDAQAALEKDSAHT